MLFAVCVLRRKKSNWREYREALALLKEFREQYRLAVDGARQARSARKQQSSRIHKMQSRTRVTTKSSKEEQPQTQRLRSQTGVKVSGPCIKVSPSQPTKDWQGPGSLSDEKDDSCPLRERT